MQHDHVLKELNFDLLTLRSGVCVGGGGCGKNICYLVATFCDANNFDMQHDYVLKNLDVDLLTLSH